MHLIYLSTADEILVFTNIDNHAQTYTQVLRVFALVFLFLVWPQTNVLSVFCRIQINFAVHVFPILGKVKISTETEAISKIKWNDFTAAEDEVLLRQDKRFVGDFLICNGNLNLGLECMAFLHILKIK